MRKYYSFWHIAFAFIILMCSSRTAVGETAAKQDWAKGISIQATPDPSYPSGDEVVIKYQVTNGSQVDLKAGSTYSGWGIKVSVESPSGKKITPYAYDPLGSGSFVIDYIPQGETVSMNFNLSHYFQFAEAGEYRVTITRRLYGNGDKPDKYRDELKGEPVDISAEPFHFRVESPSKTTVRSLRDGRTGAIPGDELDGINNLKWYEKTSAAGTPENHDAGKIRGSDDSGNRDLTQKDHTGSASLFSRGTDARYWAIAAGVLLCGLLFGYYRWCRRSGGQS